jgi:hypothetical protein
MRCRTGIFALIAVLLASAASASLARAQGPLTIGAGLGAVLNERREIPASFDDIEHKLVFVSLRLPLTPLELRGEAMWPDDPTNADAHAFIASGVFSIPLGPITPYAQAGWGDYNFGDPSRSKWSAGIGARLQLGMLGIFAEATRYNRMDTDLITAGLTLQPGG